MVETREPTAGRRGESLAVRARGGIEGLVTQGKDQVAGRLEDVAGSIRGVGERLGEEQVDLLARYADRAAEKVEEATRYLRETDLEELLADTREFARRRPEVFLGGAFVVGLLFARFLKSSAERLEDNGGRRGGRARPAATKSQSPRPRRRAGAGTARKGGA